MTQGNEDEFETLIVLFHYSAHPTLHLTGINPPVFATYFEARQAAETGLDIWEYLDETGVSYRFRYQYTIQVRQIEALLVNTQTYRSGYSEYTFHRAIVAADIASEPWELPLRRNGEENA